MERYTLDEYENLKASGLLSERLDAAKSIGNHQVDPDRLRSAIVRTSRSFFVQRGLSRAEIDRLAPSPAPPPAWRGMPTTGNVKVFALLIEFTDQPHTVAANTINAARGGEWWTVHV